MTDAAAAPPPPAPDCALRTAWHDCLFGVLAFCLWGTWVHKLAPYVSATDNIQSAAGLVASESQRMRPLPWFPGCRYSLTCP